MRVRAAAMLLALLTAGPALAEDRPRQRVGKVTLRVTQVFPETHQALVYDKATNKHVVVTEGEQLGKYEIVEVGDDELIVRVSGRELVLPAEQPAAPAAPAKPADPGLLDPYATSTPAPPAAPPSGPGPLDPYAGIAPTPAEIRVVVAPAAQRAGGSAAPLDPYAPIATPATPAPAKPDAKPPVVAKPDATPPAPPPPPPAAPAVEAIRLESMTLKRRELASALGDFDSLHKAIGFVRTGTGVRLTTIAPGSYFHGMGLRSGDVVTAINNAPLRTLDDAAAAYARLGSAKKLDLAVVRAGERGTLHFALK